MSSRTIRFPHTKHLSDHTPVHFTPPSSSSGGLDIAPCVSISIKPLPNLVNMSNKRKHGRSIPPIKESAEKLDLSTNEREILRNLTLGYLKYTKRLDPGRISRLSNETIKALAREFLESKSTNTECSVGQQFWPMSSPQRRLEYINNTNRRDIIRHVSNIMLVQREGQGDRRRKQEYRCESVSESFHSEDEGDARGSGRPTVILQTSSKCRRIISST